MRNSLDQVVALAFVDGRVVGDQHPVGAVEVLGLEDLVVDLGRVVDDDQHLGRGLKYVPGRIVSSSSCEAACVLHGAFIPDLRGAAWLRRIELVERALDLGLDVERLEALARAPFVARDDELAHLCERARGRAALRCAGVEQPRDLGVDVERRPRRGRPCARCARVSIWRISSSCSARAGGGVGRRRGGSPGPASRSRGKPAVADVVEQRCRG